MFFLHFSSSRDEISSHNEFELSRPPGIIILVLTLFWRGVDW
jgi:hypothetical protein